MTRRRLLQYGGAATILSASAAAANDPADPTERKPFRYALNFGTLIGFKLPIEEEIDLAAQAGYDAIEPWASGIAKYVQSGGRLSDLRKRIEDHGLSVPGGCSFFTWVVDDEEARKKGIEQMKREMEMFREIGAKSIAATAAGTSKQRLDDFRAIGERYRTIVEIGVREGVLPQLEVWGSAQTMNCLADVVAIAIHSGHPKARFLLDVYHLYRGNSSFESLSLLSGKSMTTFHVNDYPSDPPRESAQDKDRVYPGDGVAPLGRIFRILRRIGFDGFLSFEVFNPAYWETKDPLRVARTGLEKMKAVRIDESDG